MQRSKQLYTAGIIVVGDEILKGFTKETNSSFLCRRLFKLGVKVEKVSVIPDDLSLIANEVRLFSDKFTHVITSGGVGPTHDDITFEGVAKAFDDKVTLNSQLAKLVTSYFGPQQDQNSPVFKLAKIPSRSRLIFPVNKKTGHKFPYPVVRVKNVTLLPGIPSLLERAFDMLEDDFRNVLGGFRSVQVYIDLDEVKVANVLSKISEKYKPNVNLGSYPKIGHSYYKVKLVLDSIDQKQLKDATDDLTNQLPANCVLKYDPMPMQDCVVKFEAFKNDLLDSDPSVSVFKQKLLVSLDVVKEALDQYKPQELAVAFNGGKDCATLLHLVYISLKTLRPELFRPDSDFKLKTVYIRHSDGFNEIEHFIEETVERYDIEMITIDAHIQNGLDELKVKCPEIKGIFMGSRYSDPRCSDLKALQITDPGWPEFMRISPLLDFSYSDIWFFIRKLWLPYCSLYDKGFTSIGAKSKTGENKALEYVDGFGITRYLPAWKLKDNELERANRKSAQVPSSL